MKFNRPLSTRAMVRLGQACATVLLGVSAAQAIPNNRAPMSLIGGLRVGEITINPNLYAYPIQTSIPIAGFQALVVTTLTDQKDADDSWWYADKSSTLGGNPLPLDSNPRYTFLSTLDSGGQTHIFSAQVSAMIDLAGANREGGFDIPVTGASGTEYLPISDPIGVYLSGTQNRTGTAPLAVNANSWRGQYNTSVLTVGEDSVIPNIIGAPIFGQYAVSIRNSQTQYFTVNDQIVRTPSVEFFNEGGAPNLPQKLFIDLQDANGASVGDPVFFPSIVNLDDFADDPQTPTFWTFPFANATVTDDEGSITDQFLFDTGAQVTLLSEQTANDAGIDVGTDEPDFFVEVLGAGGLIDVPGYFLDHLHLSVTGGDMDFDNVPVLVLNVLDPRDNDGPVPGILGMNLFNDRDISIDFLNSVEPSVKFSPKIIAQWNVNAGGNWSDNPNWALGVPDGVELSANFLGAITSAKTVTVDHDFTLGQMKFDNTHSYTIAGSGRLKFETIVGPSQINVLNGSHTISAPMTFNSFGQEILVSAGNSLTISSDINALDSDVSKFGPGQLNLKNARFKSLSIDGGTVKITAGAGNQSTSKVGSLTIAGGALLDLTDAKFIVTDPPLMSVVRADVLDGRITSSLLNSNRAIGYALAGSVDIEDFGGLSVTGTDLLMRMTLKGDANLDGSVNFNDLLSLAQNYGQSAFWWGGDFTHDGNVDFNDLLPVAQNYGTSLLSDGSLTFDTAMDFQFDWTLARSMVPEPGTLSLLVLSGYFLGGRRACSR